GLLSLKAPYSEPASLFCEDRFATRELASPRPFNSEARFVTHEPWFAISENRFAVAAQPA
ncbi:hypothetical protein, partial [Paenibacillus sp. NPDC058174]|uniref:hypothetical protein n=1 Tax=Paenibacillus sp. NPDC058174 TaxID=3346366 RepID=UPI0036D7959A